jgi:hypothetical protein
VDGGGATRGSVGDTGSARGAVGGVGAAQGCVEMVELRVAAWETLVLRVAARETLGPHVAAWKALGPHMVAWDTMVSRKAARGVSGPCMARLGCRKRWSKKGTIESAPRRVSYSEQRQRRESQTHQRRHGRRRGLCEWRCQGTSTPYDQGGTQGRHEWSGAQAYEGGGREIRIANAPKHAKVIIRGRGAKESKVGCG